MMVDPTVYAESILRFEGVHFCQNFHEVECRFETRASQPGEPISSPAAELWRELWNQGHDKTNPKTLESLCKDLVYESGMVDDVNRPTAQDKCIGFGQTWLKFFPDNIQSLYIRAEFRKTLHYLKRWLHEDENTTPINTLEIDTEREMGEELEAVEEGVLEADAGVGGQHQQLGQAHRDDDIVMADESSSSTKLPAYQDESWFPNGKNYGAFIISGHPGIGKSMFLYYLLVLRLLYGYPTAFQAANHLFFVFDASGVYTIEGAASLEHDIHGEFFPSGLWCLVDINEQNPCPFNFLAHEASPLFIIQASSARPAHQEYAKNGRKICAIYTMKPFSQRELCYARQTQALSILPTYDQISRFADEYGPSAHLCYVFAARPDEYRLEVIRAVNTCEWDRITSLVGTFEGLPAKISNTVILVLPKFRNPFEQTFTIITESILHELRKNDEEGFHRHFRKWLLTFYSRSPAVFGHMLEDLLVSIISDTQKPYTIFPMKKSSSGLSAKMKNIVYTADLADVKSATDAHWQSIHFDDIIYIRGVPTQQLKENVLYVVIHNKEYPVLRDIFTICKFGQTGNLVLWLVQCIGGEAHQVKDDSFNLFEGWQYPIHYVGIVPNLHRGHQKFKFRLPLALAKKVEAMWMLPVDEKAIVDIVL